MRTATAHKTQSTRSSTEIQSSHGDKISTRALPKPWPDPTPTPQHQPPCCKKSAKSRARSPAFREPGESGGANENLEEGRTRRRGFEAQGTWRELAASALLSSSASSRLREVGGGGAGGGGGRIL
jgi:hypothetical protein